LRNQILRKNEDYFFQVQGSGNVASTSSKPSSGPWLSNSSAVSTPLQQPISTSQKVAPFQQEPSFETFPSTARPQLNQPAKNPATPNSQPAVSAPSPGAAARGLSKQVMFSLRLLQEQENKHNNFASSSLGD